MKEEDVEVHQWPIRPRGGQHVGNSSGILAVHTPTGLAFVSDTERSQFKNKARAIACLRDLVYAADYKETPHEDAPKVT